MPEDTVREKALRRWVDLQDLSLARVSNPRMGKGFFLVDWQAQERVRDNVLDLVGYA